MTDQYPAIRSGALEPFGDFVRRHVGPSDEEQVAMLKVLGYESLDALIDAAVPVGVRSFDALDLPPAVAEHTVLDELRALAARNRVAEPMIGLGYYGTITPGVIRRNVLESPAWYTAYTPYQPEISQGRLEALVELPDNGGGPQRARHGQRLAARREHRGGRGGHAHAPARRRSRPTGSSSTPTACPQTLAVLGDAPRATRDRGRRGRSRRRPARRRILRRGAAVPGLLGRRPGLRRADRRRPTPAARWWPWPPTSWP